jgi:hypothetical protein
MAGFSPCRAAVTAGVACDGDLDVCERFPAGLSSQRLLALYDSDVAGQVVCDVSVRERMSGRNQRATETVRIALRRCRPASVAGSRASGRNGTTAPPCSDCPAALRAAQAPPPSTLESSGKRSALRCLAVSDGTRSGVSRRCLCRNGGSSRRGTAQPDGLDGFVCLTLCISCPSGQLTWARAATSGQAHRLPDVVPGRSPPCGCDCACDGDSQGTHLGDARETAATLTTSAGAARVSGPVRPVDADRW